MVVSQLLVLLQLHTAMPLPSMASYLICNSVQSLAATLMLESVYMM